MPVVGAIVSAIASVVASVVSTIVSIIASVVSTIVSVIWTVISTVGSAIFSVVSAIGAYIYKAISAISTSISTYIVKAFSSTISFFTTAIKAIVSPLQGVYSAIKTVVGSLQSLVKSVIGSISSYLKPAIDSIKTVINSIVNPIKSIIGKIKEVYATIKASVIGKIIKFVKEVADFLSTIHTIAQAYQAFDQRKYLKGIWILATKFDDDLAKQGNELRAYIESNIMSIVRDIDGVFRSFRKDITGIYQYAYYLETVMKDISKYLGVKDIAHIGEGLEYFRISILLRARNMVTLAQKETMDFIMKQLHPINLLLREIAMSEREYRRYERIFNFLALKHLQPSFYGYTPAKHLLVPKLH